MLAVSNGILGIKVEGVNEIWTAPVVLFDFLQVNSSPGLRSFSLPTGEGGAEETYDIAFEQSSTFGLLPGRWASNTIVCTCASPNTCVWMSASDLNLTV